MKKSLLFIASAAAILAGCSRETEIQTPETGRKHITIQASVNLETRTTVDITDGTGNYAWTQNEQIAVFESTANAATPFTVTDLENGYFDGEIEASNTLVGAVSPMAAVTTVSVAGGNPTYTLSLSGLYQVGETNAILVADAPATIDTGDDPLYKFQFKHAAGLIKVTYVNVPVGAAGVRFTTNKPITGSVELTTMSGVEITNTDVDGPSVATVLYDDPVTEVNTTGEFYIPVPTGSYTGFEIALIDDAGNPIPGTIKSKTTAFTVNRADIVRIPTVRLQAIEEVHGYIKVTADSDITAGDYLIVYEGGTINGNTYGPMVLTGNSSTSTPYGTASNVVITNDTIDEDDYADYNIIATEAGQGVYTLKLGSKYLAVTTDGNRLDGLDEDDFSALSDATVAQWTLTAAQATNVKYTARSIRWNPNVQNEVANPRFAAYKQTASTHVTSLYKKGSSSSMAKLPANLSFAAGSPFEVDSDDAANFTAPALNNPNGLQIVWSIVDEDEIANFDETNGTLTLTGDPGTVTVTASSAETSVFAAGSASYTVTVLDLLSSIDDLKGFIDDNEGEEASTQITFNNVVVTYAKEGKAYIEDQTGGMYVFAGGTGLTKGDVLNGTTTVSAKAFHTQREITDVTGAALSTLKTGTQTVTPSNTLAVEDAADADIANEYENQLTVIEDEMVIVVDGSKKYVSDGTNQVRLFTLSGSGASLDALVDGDVILSVTGYPTTYDGVPQIVIVNTDDIVVKPTPRVFADPTSLSFTDAAGSKTITMSSENFVDAPTYAVTNNTNSAVFSTSVQGNIITVTVAANTGGEQTGVLTITGTSGTDSAVATVNVAQDAPVTGEQWVLTAITDLADGDIIAIVDQTSSKAMSNDKGTGAAPTATAVTLNATKSNITSEVPSTIQWVFKVDGSSYKFQKPGSSNYLYCFDNNNGLRVGTSSDNAFTFTSNFLYNTGKKRWIGVYSSQDWRCYTGSTPTGINNIKNTVTAFYKKVGGSGGSGTGGDLPEGTTVSVSIADYATANSWTNGTQYTSVPIDDNITATASPTGSNTGKYYGDWRFYQSGNGKLTISAASGTIKAVKITYAPNNNGVFQNGDTNVESDQVFTVNAQSVEFSVGNTGSATNGQARVSDITVVY